MPDPSPEQDSRLSLPQRTTPTWEVELLLSGATVFALVQLAGALPAFGAQWLPRLTDLWQKVANMGLVYLQCGVIVLCVAFVLHLLLRAYWVALVGMASVYPEGLQPERLSLGPIGRAWVTRRWKPLPVAIENSDNLATVVFGLGIGLARMMVTITIVAMALLLLSLSLAAATGTAEEAGRWMFWLMLAWILPYLVVQYGDRWIGHRVANGGRLDRLVQTVMAFYSWQGLGRESMPLITLYTSNVGESRGNWVLGGVVTLATLASFTTLGWMKDDLGWGQYRHFPTLQADLAQSVRHVHYASAHEAGQSPRLPFIPALQAAGRYLPLVVPYVPQLHDRLMDGCPERSDTPTGHAGRQLRAQATLACLDRAFEVTLDGAPLDLAPELYSDATRDLRGLVYMIPLTGQSRGRHELVVAMPPEAEPDAGAAPPIWRIPYWY